MGMARVRGAWCRIAAERRLESLGVRLENICLRRLHAAVEIGCAAAHAPHATALASALHAYWPQIEVKVRPHAPSAASPRASSFDVLWVERWGRARTSAVLYSHGAAAAVPASALAPRRGQPSAAPAPSKPLPSERALWRELSLKIDGKALLPVAG